MRRALLLKAVKPEAKQICMAAVGAWSFGSGSKDIVCGANELYK